MDWLFKDWDIIWQSMVSALIIYAAVIVLSRIVGLRSFAKMNTFDFAITVAVGSIIASTVMGSASATRGVAAMTTLLFLQMLIAWLKSRFDAVSQVADNTPLLLMDGEEILYDNLKASRVTIDDLRGKLREANVIELKEIRAVVLENTGDVSVLHAADEDVELADWLLEGVKRRP